MSLLVRASAALFVAVAVSACGSTPPGAAVVVGDASISIGTLDARAEAICLIQSANGQADAYSNADLRRSAAHMLALGEIASTVIDDEGLQVDASLAQLPDETIEQVNEVFEADQSETLVEYFRAQQALYAQLITIGSDLTGQAAAPETYDVLAQTAQGELESQFADYDVQFAPRLGLSGDGSTVDGFGSVSVAPADLAADTGTASELSNCRS